MTVLILYTLIWAYFWLGIQYAEHRQNYIKNAIFNCGEVANKDTQDACVNAFKRNSVNPIFFKLLMINIDN